MQQQTGEGILYLPDRYCCMQYNKLFMGQLRITNRIGLTGSVCSSKLSLYHLECGGPIYCMVSNSNGGWENSGSPDWRVVWGWVNENTNHVMMDITI